MFAPQIRSWFGPEHELMVPAIGDRDKGERSLEQRVERRRELLIRELRPGGPGQIRRGVAAVQSRFVDDPRGAVDEATPWSRG